MDQVTIPIPDFQFADKLRERAKSFMEAHFSFKAFFHLAYNAKGTLKARVEKLNSELNSFPNVSHRLIYMSYCLSYLLAVKDKLTDEDYIKTSQMFINVHVQKGKVLSDMSVLLTDAQFDFSMIMENIGYSLDRDQFSENEIKDLHSKIDAIIDKLNEIRHGQTIIVEEVEEIIEDLNKSKSDVVFGKKKFYRYMRGLSVDVVKAIGTEAGASGIKALFSSVFGDNGQGLIS